MWRSGLVFAIKGRIGGEKLMDVSTFVHLTTNGHIFVRINVADEAIAAGVNISLMKYMLQKQSRFMPSGY